MLEGLDETPWDQLTHAYGPATDVPGQIRRLAHGDDQALSELFGSIWHQGTVYEATAPAVPFLVETLAFPGADAAGVLALLGAISRGGSYVEAHWSLWSEEQRASRELLERRARERAHVDRAVAAVSAQAEEIASLADDPRVEVRRTLPYLLIAPEFPSKIVARTLERRFPIEDDPEAICGNIFAAGAHRVSLPDGLDSSHPRALVRLAVAALCVRSSTGEPGPGTLVILAESVAEAFDQLDRSIWTADTDFIPWLFFYCRATSATRLDLLARWSKADSVEFRHDAACALGDEMAFSPELAREAVGLVERWLSEESDPIVASVLRDALAEAGDR